MQIATFVVSVVALATSMSLLGWNVAQFLLTGGRAKVELVAGVLGAGGVITVQPGPGMARQLDDLAAEHGYTRRVIGVLVKNTGRAPIRVQRWGITCPGVATFHPLADSMGPDLPATIEAGAREMWVVDLHPAVALSRASAAVQQQPAPARGVVELGTGRTLTSPTSLPVG